MSDIENNQFPEDEGSNAYPYEYKQLDQLDEEDLVILPDEVAEELGIAEGRGPDVRMSLLDLEKRLFFDFDDTLVSTQNMKDRVLFQYAVDLLPGLTHQQAEGLYDVYEGDFSLRGWESALRDYAQQEGVDINGNLLNIQEYFAKKFRAPETEIIPQDTLRLVQLLSRLGVPLNVLTKGHPHFQEYKLQLFAEALSKSVLGVNPLQINVAIVSGKGSGEKVETSVGDLKFDTVVLDLSKYPVQQFEGKNKGEALAAIAEQNEVVKMYYINDKEKENKKIRAVDAELEGCELKAYRINRTGEAEEGTTDVFNTLERVIKAVHRYEDEDFLSMLSERVVSSTKRGPLELLEEQSEFPALHNLEDVSKMLRELNAIAMGVGSNVMIKAEAVPEFLEKSEFEGRKDLVLVCGGPELKEITDKATQLLLNTSDRDLHFVLSGAATVWDKYMPLSEAETMQVLCYLKVLQQKFIDSEEDFKFVTDKLNQIEDRIVANQQVVSSLFDAKRKEFRAEVQRIVKDDGESQGEEEVKDQIEKRINTEFKGKILDLLKDVGVSAEGIELLPRFEDLQEELTTKFGEESLANINKLFTKDRMKLEEQATNTPGNFFKTISLLEAEGEKDTGKLVVISRDFHAMRGYGTYLYAALMRQVEESWKFRLSAEILDPEIVAESTEYINEFWSPSSYFNANISMDITDPELCFIHFIEEKVTSELERIERLSGLSLLQKASEVFKLSLAIDRAVQDLKNEYYQESSSKMDESSFNYRLDFLRSEKQRVLKVVAKIVNPQVDVKCCPAETERYTETYMAAVQNILSKRPRDISVSEWEKSYKLVGDLFDGVFTNAQKMYEYHASGIINPEQLPPIYGMNVALQQMVKIWNEALEETVESNDKDLDKIKLQSFRLDPEKMLIPVPELRRPKISRKEAA